MKTEAIHLHADDNVAIAKMLLDPGRQIALRLASGREMRLQIQEAILPGHKVALTDLNPGNPVKRYGQVIGLASAEIPAGSHIHTHNIEPAPVGDQRVDGRPADDEADSHLYNKRTFSGYLRADGQVGTRNYIAVIASVNCSAFVCQQIAAYFSADKLSVYPQVDGVIPLTHGSGCAASQYDHLQRTLAGMAQHPNVGGYILVGLGCEGNQLTGLVETFSLTGSDLPMYPDDLFARNIQETGGTAATIQAGIAAVEAMLPHVNAVQRSPQPLSKLTLAMECGGSDSWSGITANPLVGRISDIIAGQGGTIVMSETTEIYGAHHLLAQRAVSPEVAEKLLKRIEWWRDYLSRLGGDFEDNPAPGNKKGGLSNICEKSLGGIAKSGSSPLMDVYEYAEKIESPGFVFMDTPGYDPPSVTGMVAGGANLVLFTTGRGSAFGFKPAPVIKISTNSELYNRMTGDMDFNAGDILDGIDGFEGNTQRLLDLVIQTASGQPSKSEALGIGADEFVPWTPYGVV